MQYIKQAVQRIVITIGAILLTACVSQMSLRPVLPQAPIQMHKGAISVYLSDSTSKHVHRANVGLTSTDIPFGRTLERQLASQFERALESADVQIEGTAESTKYPQLVVSFAGISVDAGALTFLPSTSKVTLRATFRSVSGAGVVTQNYTGEATESPGAAGALPAPGLNDHAHFAALTRSCELALSRAVQALVAGTVNLMNAAKK